MDERVRRRYANHMDFIGSSGHGSSVACARREWTQWAGRGVGSRRSAAPEVREWARSGVCRAEKGGGPVQRYFMVISEVVAP